MTRLRTWLRQLPFGDRIVVGLAALLVLLIVVSRSDEPTAGIDERTFDVGAAALLAAGLALLLLSKRFPGTIALAVIAVTTAWFAVGYTQTIINLAPLVAFYQLGATGDRRRQLGAGGVALGFVGLSILVFSDEPVSQALNAVAWPVAAMVFGELVRNRRLLLDEYAERATTAEAEADQRVTQERLRIARDVHDVLAHTVSAMTVQAGVAVDTLDRDPVTARASLANIRAAGKEAMAEVKATIAVLRGGDASNGAATAPAPRLDRIPELVDRARARGLDVELCMELGEDSDVENLVELTAYRIVQEGLTNVIRHAACSHAEVRITRDPSELIVEVRDNGRGAAGKDVEVLFGIGPGFGLRGMHERVEPVGGKLHYGPHADGGWEVVAVLPTGTTRS